MIRDNIIKMNENRNIMKQYQISSKLKEESIVREDEGEEKVEEEKEELELKSKASL